MKWYPSNGTEGEWFIGKYCYHCFNDKGVFTGDPDDKYCDILARSFGGEKVDEWIETEDGPTCTSHIPYNWEDSIRRQSYKKAEVIEIIDPNQLKLKLDA